MDLVSDIRMWIACPTILKFPPFGGWCHLHTQCSLLPPEAGARPARTHGEEINIGTQSGSSGFTLIELLVVLAVVAILQTLAAPALTAMVNFVRLTAAVNALFSSLILARSEAIKRNSCAVVCKSVSGEASIATGGWEQGWIVFHDANNNAARDADETILSREAALSQPFKFEGNDPVSSYVSFNPMGRTLYTSGAFQAGRLTVCPESATQVDARQIVISSAGRPRTVKTTVALCPL